MSEDYKLLSEMYQNTVSDIVSPAPWQSFLKTAAYNYKLEFHEQVLIYAQKPTATIAMSENDWLQKYGRTVQKERAIGFMDIAKNNVKFLFDITDTNDGENLKAVPVFKFGKTEQHTAETVAAINKEYELSERDIENAIFSAADSLTANRLEDVFEELKDIVQDTPSAHFSSQLLFQKISRLISNSAAYMCMLRCGLPVENSFSNADFRDVSVFGSSVISSIGTVMSRVSFELMQTIIKANIHVDKKMYKNSNRTFATASEKEYNKDTKENKAEERQVTDNGTQLFRETKAPIYQRTQTDTVHEPGNARETSGTPDIPANTGNGNVGQSRRTQSGDVGADRTVQGGGPDKVGGTDDKPPRNNENAGSRRTDLQLKQNESRRTAGLKNTLPLFLSQEQIDDVLCRGSMTQNGKYRIFDQFKKKMTVKENAEFLKKEYGIAGSSSNGLSLSSDNKGIEISDNSTQEKYLMPWKAVAKRIEQLIEANRYLFSAEIEKYPEYKNKLKEREIRVSVEKEYEQLISDYNDVAEKGLNRYALLVGCMNEFVVGDDITYTLHMKGDNIYPLIFDSLDTIGQVPELAERAVALKQTFQPYYELSVGTRSELPTETHYVYHTGDTVYVDDKEYTIMECTENIVLSNVAFPILQQSYSKNEFEEKLEDNSLNERLKVTKLVSTTEEIKNADEAEPLPVYDRETEILYDVLSAIKMDDIKIEFDADGIVAKVDDNEWHGAEFYHFLVDEVLVFEGNNKAVGIDNELFNDFKALSEHNGVQIKNNRSRNFWKNYSSVKNKNADCIVLYQVGDFFEIMGDDAHKAADVLDLVLTSRNIENGQKIAMCGFPVHNLNNNLERLTEKGYRVVVSSVNDKKERVETTYILDENKTNDLGTDIFGDLQIRDEQLVNSILGKVVSIDDKSYRIIKIESTAENGEVVLENIADPTDKTVEIFGFVSYLVNQPEQAEPTISVEQPKVNYKITDNDLGVGGPKERFKNNIAAINTLHNIEFENRLATPEEQERLSKYVGWGGLQDAFDENKDNWANEFQELYTTLSPEEYEAARASVLTAFYTPPVVIQAIYNALENMGFKKGNICDPACGIGHFIGMMPETMQNSKFYGIEIDSISGRIAQQLYPNAAVAVQGFESTTIPDSFLDVMVGNVPFGDSKVYDERYNKHKFLIHDYFFAKSLDKVRPGGVIAFVTSKGTMDKSSPAVRKYIAERAELVGAIRLPDNTFKRAAGTEVTSDIIFLQKRERTAVTEPDWLYLDTDENGVTMNRYFVEHPEMILGKMELESTRFGKMEPTCKANLDIPLEEQLQTAISHLSASIQELENEAPEEDGTVTIPADPNVRNFSYTIQDGEIYFRENSTMELCTFSAKAKERLKGLISIRDSLRCLLDYQTEDYPEEQIIAQRYELNARYDDFVKQFGRVTSRTNKSAFREDSSSPLIYALENLDDDGNFLRKADIFSKRTIKARKPIDHADTAADALAVSISEKACVDLEFMASLMGGSEYVHSIIEDLKDVIFKDPLMGSADVADNLYLGWQTADEYLSGNVRKKLEAAKIAAEKHPEFQINVDALQKVQPKDLTAAEISVRLGANWVPQDVYNQFMYELLDTPNWIRDKIQIAYNPYLGEWKISNRSYDSGNIKAYSTYGTKRAHAYRIIEDTLNLRDTKIFDTVIDDDGKVKSVLNAQETAIAQGKQDAIKQAFVSWIWKNQERRHRLCKLYNETFNSNRPREYNGQHIVYHGMNPDIVMRKHQNDAVAHTLYGGNTLLAHVVGAGKTFEMAASAMESKYLGLCQKSVFVVPNHLTEQWAAEFLLLYPNANLLVTRKEDFQKENRKRLCSKIATGDFDAIIIGQSQFEKIPVSAERQEMMIRSQIDELQLGIESAQRENGEHFSVKAMERSKRNLEDKLKRLSEQSRKDDVVTFEQLGVDRMFIDEAHYYKNLFLVTKMRNVAGIGQSEAQKSTDLFTKCQYLDEITGGKGVVFATGTPISNSMVELYTMQRYLQYDTLRELNMERFDEWASNYGETVSAMELAPEGTGYRFKTRFSKFNNLPELMSIFKEVADIKTADILNLNVPKVNYHNIVVTPSDFQKQYIESLAERAEAVHNHSVEPYIDNMLKITNEGRKLALDERLIAPLAIPTAQSKVDSCADNVFSIWKNSMPNKSAQLVFCDLSTPKGNGEYSVYDELKRLLIEKGIPENEIAFIHNAKSDIQKKNLFAKVRNGSVRVLIGSTSKMGAGTNVQERLIALHHLDCPWRPSDLEQREGRIIRQGNGNDEVDIYRYVTEATFDSYMWQLVENKQKFISQIMTSKSPVRTAEDVDETSLSYGEVKALASGNPMIMEKCQLEAEVGKLNLQKSNFLNQKFELEDKIAQFFPQEIQRLQQRIKGYTADIESVKAYPVPEEGISPMELNGVIFTDKAKAGKILLAHCMQMKKNTKLELGSYRGFQLTLSYEAGSFFVDLKNKLTHVVSLGSDALGNIQRIDNKISGLETALQETVADLSETKKQFETAKIEVENEFEQESELLKKTEQLAKVNSLLTSNSSTKAKNNKDVQHSPVV